VGSLLLVNLYVLKPLIYRNPPRQLENRVREVSDRRSIGRRWAYKPDDDQTCDVNSCHETISRFAAEGDRRL
jgi:hypothetical protein